MPDPLLSIPGLGGYLAQRDRNLAQENAGLAQLQNMMGLRALLVKEAQDEQYRSALAGARTPEEQTAVAARFSGPQGVLTHADRQAQIAATKEATRMRLEQQAQIHLDRLAREAKDEVRADRKLALQEQAQRVKQMYDAASLRMTGERLFHDTGIRVETPQAPAQAPAQATFRTTAPTFQDALAMFQTGGGQPMTVEYGQGGVPLAKPAPEAVAPQPAPQPAPPDNLDARDLRLRNLPSVPPAPAPTPSTALPAMPPEIASAPQKIRNQWVLDQAKKQAGGATSASEEVVDAIVQGRMQVPTGFALRSPYWQDVIQRVAQKDPNFDASKYGARAAARRTFASGPEARNVTALNTVIGHLGTLDEAAMALENKDLRAANAVINRARMEFGDPRIVSFDTARQAVAEETMRVFRQVGASQIEAQQWRDRISSSGSPAQLRANIRTLGDLLESRVEAIGRQFERTVQEQGNPAQIDPKNRALLDRFRQGGSVAKGFDDPDKERRYQEWKARQGR